MSAVHSSSPTIATLLTALHHTCLFLPARGVSSGLRGIGQPGRQTRDFFPLALTAAVREGLHGRALIGGKRIHTRMLFKWKGWRCLREGDNGPPTWQRIGGCMVATEPRMKGSQGSLGAHLFHHRVHTPKHTLRCSNHLLAQALGVGCGPHARGQDSRRVGSERRGGLWLRSASRGSARGGFTVHAR